MYIKQLEIDNFKSFARKVEIPLLEGFTTVSGPNGSGKSNIIDSILFALGLATTRNLRAEKVSHLISTYTNKNEATVKVTFSGTEDGNDFSIARRLKKASNGTYLSTYYLNDSVPTKYIYNNFRKPLTLEDVSSVASLSPTYFSKKFKLITGMGFKEYLNYVRLKHAQTALLTTDSSITDIALEYGFNDSNYFKDLFKKVYGKSPREYRKNPD